MLMRSPNWNNSNNERNVNSSGNANNNNANNSYSVMPDCKDGLNSGPTIITFMPYLYREELSRLIKKGNK